MPASVAILICLIIVIRPHARRLTRTVLLDVDSSRRSTAVRRAAVVAVLAAA